MKVEFPDGKFRSVPTFHSYTGRNKDEVQITEELNKDVAVNEGTEIPDPTRIDAL